MNGISQLLHICTVSVQVITRVQIIHMNTLTSPTFITIVCGALLSWASLVFVHSQIILLVLISAECLAIAYGVIQLILFLSSVELSSLVPRRAWFRNKFGKVFRTTRPTMYSFRAEP
jgi:hypothetical protein